MSEEPADRQLARGNYIAQASGGSTAVIASYEYAPPRPVDAATLAAARQQLAKLPLDEISDPAPLPHGSRMPLSPNPMFVGRGDKLQALAASLRAGETTAIGQVRTVAATGLGGIGKTQLASEFVHRYGQYFAGGVYWLSFADASAVPAEVATCGGAGRMELRPDFSILPLEDQVREVMSTWQSALPRLLVFDNCEEETLLDQWRPPAGGCRVLVTSRKERWDPTLGVRALPLNVLSRQESLALLREHRPDLPAEDPDLDAIARELGDLPLALHLAGSYLARYRFAVSPGDYLAQLRRPDLLRHRSLRVAKGISPTRREQDVARTFALSYERLDTADPTDALAVTLLARAACFAPGEPVPRDLLKATLDLPDDDPDAVLQAEDALIRLAELGLLETEEAGALRLHRLLAAFGRDVAADAEAQNAAEVALLDTISTLLDEGYPALLLVFQPHLRAVTNAAREREDEQAALLCNQLGSYLQMIGEYAGARPLHERALEIREKVLGEEHPNTALSLNNLAMLLKAQGGYAEARPLYERALEISEKALGEEHPNTALSLNNLAGLLDDQGEYAEARPLYERALEIREKVLGEEHPDAAASLNNLAGLLQAQGGYAEARPLYERALEISEKALGEEHPNTATSLNNLATLLYSQGEYAEARPLYERALEIREKVLGEEHPDTATSLNNLATLLQAQGGYAEARLYLERALEISEKALGEEHPDTALSLNNLATLLYSQGEYAEARPHLERALEIREKVLGEEHPNTATSLNNLAGLLYSQGEYAEVRLYLERALEISEKALGEEHPDTATSLNNLAMLLDDQGEYAEARLYLERALEISEKALGEEHPDTATSLNNLATLLYSQGEYAEARPHLERALEISEKVLGPEHPNTELVRRNLASLDEGR